MWAKLIDIVETKWHESLTPKHHLAKAINTLYGAMSNCHIAFQYFENDQNEQNFANFAFAIDGMISTLKNLHPTLKIFDQELADRLNNYAMGSDRIAAMSHPRDLVKSQIRFLRELVHEESNIIGLPEEDFTAFRGAKDQLSKFISTNLTMSEIFEQP
ncbi:hypothetical protein [Methylomicrobium lacus]|uniref:hypothetical protein n=1 Tax=Methylomicrobium lacus TaxID=136992 RepID=UPI00045E9B2E|nr:hypothetical protein [Methylomicrobium lacus]